MGTSASSMSDEQNEQWKHVYREFILQVHPDFFQDSPKERAVNEKSLKTFSQHLERLKLGHAPSTGGSSSRLVFFVKQAGESAEHEEADDSHERSRGIDIDSSCPSPRKFLLPLEAHHEMAAHLLKAGITSVPPPEPPRRQADHDHNRSAETSSSGWHSWGDDLFGGTAANRAWDEAAAAAAAASSGGRARGRSAFSSVQDNTREGRQRTTQWGAAFERASGGGDESTSRLGRVLASDLGRALVRERRASSRKVRQLVGELREEYGFGEFTFRCGWSKSNLCVALGSLLETCHANRGALKVPDFGGLEVVFLSHPSALDGEEIRLCPADVPNQWMAVLERVTPDVLSRSLESSRDIVSLQERASSALRGAQISRGLSCSKARYREFLERLREEEGSGDVSNGDEAGTDVSQGDWSGLRCRVEEGFSRVSKVLEDGTIQVGSEMTLESLQRCLDGNLASSSAAAANNLHLADAAAATARSCRRSLCLEAVERAPHAVSLPQMITACEALVKFGERADEGSLGAEAVAARRRLRGHSVRIVGSRVGVCDGVNEDGEILVAWNWAEEEQGSGGLPPSSTFY
eukprot:g14714.t1